jgi:hypothetical protein
MSGMLEIMRKVANQEMERNHSCLLGVVSGHYPHTSKNDENNYEVDVKIKHQNLELRRVPVAVAHMGVAAVPQEGDLVLVQFIHGDLNQPVVTGRFYHADNRPPLHQEDEILFEQRVASDNTLNHLRFTADGTIYLQRKVDKPEDNSKALTSVKIDGSTGAVEIKVGDKVMLEMKSDSVTVTQDSAKLEMKSGKFKFTGDVEINGDLVAKNGGQTKISGNKISGA